MFAIKKVQELNPRPVLALFYFYLEEGQTDRAKPVLDSKIEATTSPRTLEYYTSHQLALDIVADSPNLPKELTHEQSEALLNFSGTMLNQYYYTTPNQILEYLRKVGASFEHQQYLENAIKRQKQEQEDLLKRKKDAEQKFLKSTAKVRSTAMEPHFADLWGSIPVASLDIIRL